MKSIYLNWLLSVVLLLTFVAGSCSSPVGDKVDPTQSSEVAYNSTDLQPTLVPTVVHTVVPTVSLIEPVTEEVDDEPSLTSVDSTDTVSTPVITVIATPTPVANPTQASSQVDMTDPKQIKESIIKDPNLCDTASGLVAQVCMDWMVDMIKANPDLCNTATGLMAYMCQSEPPKGGAEGSNDLHNPCTSLTGGDKEKCEESFKNNPYSKPPPDPNNTVQMSTYRITILTIYPKSPKRILRNWTNSPGCQKSGQELVTISLTILRNMILHARIAKV